MSQITKGKSLRRRHLVITRRVSIILIIIRIVTLISRGLWRRRGRRSKAIDACLSACNASYPSVHLTHLISEIVKMTTKISMHLLQLLHDGIKSDTSYRGRRSGGRKSRGRRWNNKSCKIIRLHSWPLRLMLGLAPLNRTSAYGTCDGEERRERNVNVKVLKDPHNSQRKDELITNSGILRHIYDRCDEMKGKVNGEILQKRQKKMRTRLSDRVIVRQQSESECHHYVKEPRAFCKTRAWSV